ncbi:MAG TPA: biotin--[acetyl-CoA-carboxylase] ligase [Micropepsaceae bacterium]|nr:biotin--[acetyl-CoA-carboxylase] ligase [Micropepsaceae bacterium]
MDGTHATANRNPDGLRLIIHETLDSTNEEARRLAEKGERGPLWILASCQTAGRGRRGRNWISEEGNLFATLLLNPQGDKAHWPQLGFAMALGTAEMLEAYTSATEVKLKWPNDVLVQGRKIAGILLEAYGDALAIGVGVNLKSAPEGTEFPAISFERATGNAPDPQSALAVLAGRMHAWYEVWCEQGFHPLKRAWLARAYGLGGPMTARLANEELNGVFEALDEDGALMLRMADGAHRRVTAADIFLPG